MPDTRQAANIELYSAWATTQRDGQLYGRVHKGEPLPPPEEGEGLARRLHASFLDLDTCALPNARVRLSGFPEAGLFTADAHGFLRVRLPSGMRPGTVRTVELDTPHYTAPGASTTAQVWGDSEPPLGIISDIDDTLTDTGVTRKLELLKNTFFEDSYDVKVFAGAPQAFVSIAGKNPSLLPVFYLSGSPWGLHKRISEAFDLKGFPPGTMILRRYSQEPLDPFNFKLPHLREIVDANPGRRWILFGDAGEKDPEVYHTLTEERPNAVDAVFIHNVTNEDPASDRLKQFTVFRDWNEVGSAIRDRKLGSAAAASGS